jgi:hypothetical protein
LVNGGECAYVIFDEKGITKCGIEKAYEDGVVDWQKPISCHLYPIRITEYRNFSAVNYHEWSVCSDACTLGKELQVPVYKFLKTPLIRKYGEEFYNTLCELQKNGKENLILKVRIGILYHNDGISFVSVVHFKDFSGVSIFIKFITVNIHFVIIDNLFY